MNMTEEIFEIKSCIEILANDISKICTTDQNVLQLMKNYKVYNILSSPLSAGKWEVFVVTTYLFALFDSEDKKRERSEKSNIPKFTRLQDPQVHLPVTYFLFRDTTFHLALALFVPLHQKYGLYTSSHLPIPNILFFQTSS